MTSITPMQATDLLKLNSVNLDVLTENYYLGYYVHYLATWPTMFFKSSNPQGRCVGYMMGKTEGPGKEWHSHVTAVTVDNDYRRLGIARQLVDQLKRSSEEESADCYFMDLYVRTTNRLAIDMYRRFGFEVFRRVVNYYASGDSFDKNSDAFGKKSTERLGFFFCIFFLTSDMRMPLKRDTKRESLHKSSYTFEDPHYVYKYDRRALV